MNLNSFLTGTCTVLDVYLRTGEHRLSAKSSIITFVKCSCGKKPSNLFLSETLPEKPRKNRMPGENVRF